MINTLIKTTIDNTENNIVKQKQILYYELIGLLNKPNIIQRLNKWLIQLKTFWSMAYLLNSKQEHLMLPIEKCYIHPQCSNVYSTHGTTLTKLLVTGDQWLDPSTFRVAFDLVNNETDAAKILRPVGGPHSFCKRMRVLCNGQIVENMADENRVHEIFNVLSSSESRVNESSEAFGNTWDVNNGYATNLNHANFSGISGGGSSHTVLFKPLSGLLNQPKFLP